MILYFIQDTQNCLTRGTSYAVFAVYQSCNYETYFTELGLSKGAGINLGILSGYLLPTRSSLQYVSLVGY